MLIELLVAIPATVAVGGAAMALLGVFSHEEQFASERTQAVEAQQVATNRITRDIRQASAATVLNGGSGLQLTTYVFSNGAKVPSAVTYDCLTGACTRRVGTGPATPVITGVRNPTSVFSMTTSTHVSVSLRLDDASVTDGARLVNAP
ncbi:MAG TPA: hypothetical protein VIL49_04320 [Capillimicrobium sp.]